MTAVGLVVVRGGMFAEDDRGVEGFVEAATVACLETGEAGEVDREEDGEDSMTQLQVQQLGLYTRTSWAMFPQRHAPVPGQGCAAACRTSPLASTQRTRIVVLM